MRWLLAVGLIIFLLLVGLNFPQYWGLSASALILVVLGGCLWGYERRATGAREVALIACLAALAGAARVPFAALPNVQPTTFLVVYTGFALGPFVGGMVGCLGALVSNFFLGQGPWTPWQMLAWGLAGLLGGIAKRMWLPLVCCAWGYVFGLLMTIWHWTAFVYPLTWSSFWTVYLLGVWFDTMHALGNLLLSLLFGPMSGALTVTGDGFSSARFERGGRMRWARLVALLLSFCSARGA